MNKEKLNHPSNSDVQKDIENVVVSLLSEELNKKIACHTIEYEDAKFNVDLYFESNDEIIIGEVYAGINKLKPGQKKKIAIDFLKIINFPIKQFPNLISPLKKDLLPTEFILR